MHSIIYLVGLVVSWSSSVFSVFTDLTVQPEQSHVWPR